MKTFVKPSDAKKLGQFFENQGEASVKSVYKKTTNVIEISWITIGNRNNFW